MLGDIRRTRHISQQRAAALMGCNRSTIGHYEQGLLSPSLHAVYDLAHIYRVPISHLFTNPLRRDLGPVPDFEPVAIKLLKDLVDTRDETVPDLRTLRLRRGLSQTMVGYVLGVSASTVSRWESGHALPDLPVMLRLAELLRCSAADVYMGLLVAQRSRHGIVMVDGASSFETSFDEILSIV